MARSITLHGGSLDVMRNRFPDAPEPWVDLSTGVNPWSYPNTRLDSAALQHLPTQQATDTCRKVMARSIGAASDSLLLAPGSELLIRLLPTVLHSARVGVAAGSYGDHAAVWGSGPFEMRQLQDPLQHADELDTVVVVNPNNPDGRCWSREELLAAAQDLGARGGHLIVDEAYADLKPEESLVDACGIAGLIVLRSFGKFFGLAGVRLGALLAPDVTLAAMAERLGVWPVSGPALTIATRAYNDTAWQRDTRKKLQQARKALDKIIVRSNIKIVGGTDLFRLLWLADAGYAWRTLAEAGIYARHFAWHPNYLRIGIPANDNALDRLDRALSLVSP